MRYVPGHIVRWLTIGPDQHVELPPGALLTGEGWRLATGELHLAVTFPRDAPPAVYKTFPEEL